MNTPVLEKRKEKFKHFSIPTLVIEEIQLFLLGKKILIQIITIKIQFWAYFTSQNLQK